MGRKSHRRELDIWINGEHVGIWLIPTRGEAELRYDPAWLSSPFGRPLSMSLPFGVGDVPVRGPAVENYFRNLLPDSDDIRNRMAVKFRLGSAEPFDLLEAVGRDCVGAVQLVAPGDKPEGFDRIDCTPLSDEGVARHLQAVVQSHRSDQQSHQDEFRLCLAGAQEKSGLMLHKDRWCLPHGATPSTHIFKLPMAIPASTFRPRSKTSGYVFRSFKPMDWMWPKPRWRALTGRALWLSSALTDACTLQATIGFAFHRKTSVRCLQCRQP